MLGIEGRGPQCGTGRCRHEAFAEPFEENGAMSYFFDFNQPGRYRHLPLH